MASPDSTVVFTASISSSGTGTGILPAPTMLITPGVVNTGTRRSKGSNLQNIYPGKSGSSSSLTRSDQRRRTRQSGRYSLNPLSRRPNATAFDFRESTLSAYHLLAPELIDKLID